MNNVSKIIIAELRRQIKKLTMDKEILEQALSDRCIDYDDFCNAIDIAKLEITNRHIQNLLNKMRKLKQ